MPIKDNLLEILKTIPQGVKLVVVSKTRTNEEIMEAYNSGQRVFGENKVQELLRKQKELPQDIEWHLIGHLQTNKVKSVVPYVSLIHSVDSFKLFKTINQEAEQAGRIVNCLLQLHIAKEETKFGFSYEELKTMLSTPDFALMNNVIISGVMGMATFTDDHKLVRSEFGELSQIFDDLRSSFFQGNENFKELSMGMSDDYRIAIGEGSTIVRIGSSIFGPRQYPKEL